MSNQDYQGDEVMMVTKQRRGGQGSTSSLPPPERHALETMRRGLKAWRRIRETMPLQYVNTFIEVALHEGLGVTAYAQGLDVAPSVMSRHLLDLGDRNRHGDDGWGLVTLTQDPQNLRRHQAFLTNKGRALAHEMCVLMALPHQGSGDPTEDRGPPRTMDVSSWKGGAQ